MRTAALLRILVKTQGAARAAQDLLSVDAAGRKATVGLDKTTRAVSDADTKFSSLGGSSRGMASQLVVVGNGGRNAADAINKAKGAAAGADSAFDSLGDSLGTTGERAHDAADGLGDVDHHSRRTKVALGGLQGGLINTNAAFSAMRNVIGLVKIPAFTVAASAAVQAVNALAGGAVALGSALGGPMTAGAAAGAVGMTALIQSMLTFKLATGGVKDALKAQIELQAAAANGTKLTAAQQESLNKKLQAVPPAARGFVKYVASLQDELGKLRQAAAGNLFPGVTAGLKAAMGNFGVFRKVVGATAESIGGLAKRAGELIGGKAFGSDIQRIGLRNADIITHLGNALLAVVSAFRHVLVAAGPLTSWLAKSAEGFAKTTDHAARAGRESGRMAAFFARARDVMSTVASMAGHLARGFFNIGKAAAPLGRTILQDLDKLAGRFEDWTESASGKNDIANYFREIKGPLYEAAGLVGDITAAFFNLGGGSDTLTPLLKAVRSDLLPALTDVIENTSAAFGPVLIDALTNFVRLFGQVAGTSGPLNIFVGTLGALAGALADLLATNPALNTMVVTWIGFNSVLSATKLAASALGLTKLAGGIKAAAGAYKALAAGTAASEVAQKRGTAAMIAGRAAMLLAAAASGIAAGAMWVLNASLLGFPLVAIIAALVAVGVGLYVLYKKVKPVHDAIDWLWDGMQSVFGWIKDHWVLVGALITGPFGLAIYGIVKHWNTIKDVLSAAAGAVIKVVTAPFDWLINTYFPHAWNDIKGPAGAAWRAITGVISGAVRAVVGVVRSIVNALAGFLSARWGNIRSATSAAWQAISRAISGPINAVLGFLRPIVNAIGGFLSERWNNIRNNTSRAWGAVRDAVMGPVRAVGRAVRDVIGDMAGWLSSKWTAIGKRVGQFATNLKNGVMNAFKAVVGVVVDFVNAILSVIDKIPGVDPGRVKNPLNKSTGAPGTGRGDKATAKMARGGAYASTGGFIDSPMVFMGEEAPRHPEYVIPTNPAYRKRAQGLLSQAAGAIGLAQGGLNRAGGPVLGFAHGNMWSQAEMANLWAAVNPGLGDPDVMAAIAMAESGGNAAIVNSIGASGLWQIHPAEPGVLDPTTNARIAGRKLRTQGLRAWEAYTGPDGVGDDGPWRRFYKGGGGGGGGIFGAVGDILGKIGGSVKALLGKLPNPADMLPDWLQGMGKWVVGKASGWMKDKVGGLLDVARNAIGGATAAAAGGAKGPAGLGTFAGLPMANWVIEALKYAQSKGVDVRPTSGYRSHAQNVAAGRNYTSEHEGTQYPHGAVDFGGYTTGLAMKMAVVNATRDFKYPLLAPIGFKDDGHASGTGHYRGGVFGAVSRAVPAYANGGLARGGLALVGERGPELASLPRGTRVFSNAKTRSMGFRDGGAWGWGGMAAGAPNPRDPWSAMRKGLSALIDARGPSGGGAAAGAAPTPMDQGLVAALAKAVKTMRKKSPKLRATARKNLLGAMAKLQVPSALNSSAGLAEAAVNVYGDYADRASSMSSTDDATGVTMPGEFQGKTQGDWLGDQLNALLQWRNALIRIREWVEQHRAEVEKTLAAAWAKYRQVSAQLKELAARQAKLAKQQAWWVKALAVLKKHPKMNALGIKYVRNKLTNTKKGLEETSKQMAPLSRVKGSLEGTNGIVAALTGSRDALNTASGDALTSLTEVQGLGSPMNVMGVLPDTGVLGGRILETQMQIRDLTAAATKATDPNSGATDNADLQAGMIRDLQNQLARAALANYDSKFMTQVERFKLPAFAMGGIAPGGLALVGERGPELAMLPGGTRVNSAADSAAMMAPTTIQVVVLDGAVDTNKIKVIANSEANVVIRREAQRGARSLPGRGGGIQYS